MIKSIYTPHDRFFKQAMSDVRVAREFFLQHLPELIKCRVDFESLLFHKETFVDEEFKLFAADVIYSAKIDEQKAYFYTIIEQQTQPDQWLPFRLMQYVLRLLAYHHKTFPEETLPLVYPCIFYNGHLPYKFSTAFFELFGAYQTEMQMILNQPFQLIDLLSISDEELRKYLWSGILEFVLKHRFAGDFMQFAEQTMKWLHRLEQNGGYNYAKSVIHYVIDRLEGQDVDKLVILAEKTLSPELGEQTMTFAEQLIQKGMQQGMQQGLRQGKHKVLERLLKRRFNSLPESYKHRLETANEETLHEWIDRSIDAKSLEDVFAD